MTVSLPDNPGVIAKPPSLFLIAIVSGFALELWLPTHFIHGTARFALGAVLLVAGIALMSASIRRQRSAGTNIETDRPTQAIVSDGPYRFSRNPIYVAFVLVFLAVAVLGDSLWVLACLAPFLVVLRYGVIAREEAYLERKFGDAYRLYRARVRRWL